jgi:hypothetical protein
MKQSKESSSSTTTTTTTTTITSPPPQAILISNTTTNTTSNTTSIQPRVVDAIPISGSELRNDVGICRGCGQRFNRPPNCHDAQAQYYRCKECCKLKIQDFCIVS